MNTSNSDKVFNALDHFRIELPSWGFANTGTRFGKSIQPAAGYDDWPNHSSTRPVELSRRPAKLG